MDNLPVHKKLLDFGDIGGDMRERVKGYGLAVIFEPMIGYFFKETEDHLGFNKTLFYILMLYSKDSDAVTAGVSWKQNKLAVAQQNGITGKLKKDLVDLEIPEIVDSIQRYLDYQGSKAWSHLCMIRDLYDQMVLSALRPASPSEGLTWDQKKKNAEYANDLYREIAEWEQRIREEERNQEEGRSEIRRKKPRAERFTLRTEDILAKVKDAK